MTCIDALNIQDYKSKKTTFHALDLLQFTTRGSGPEIVGFGGFSNDLRFWTKPRLTAKYLPSNFGGLVCITTGRLVPDRPPHPIAQDANPNTLEAQLTTCPGSACLVVLGRDMRGINFVRLDSRRQSLCPDCWLSPRPEAHVLRFAYRLRFTHKDTCS